MSETTSDPTAPIKYPKSVFFIVGNELCERFSYYGLRAILSIYVTDILLLSEAYAKVVFHTFSMLAYFFPIFGAIIADTFLGKFRTIFYISLIYAGGEVLLALAATPPLHLPLIPVSLTALFLITVGTGGIKPCVSAFGGDQFIMPQQKHHVATFFSMFYFIINLGALFSTFLSPILREKSCFGRNECFSLAFGVPGALMIIATTIFVMGKKMYIIKKPQGNVIIQVLRCIGNAIKVKSKSKERKPHWLDYAEEKYGAKVVNDTKKVFHVLVLFLPLSIFWALFDQQGSAWTFLARRMDGDLGFYTILPDQMQVANPALVLIFIPLFQYAVYPLLSSMRILKKPLQRLVAGGTLAAISFIISAVVTMAVEAENPLLPEAGSGQIIIYNNLNCNLNFTTPGLNMKNFIINSMDYWKYDVNFTNKLNISYEATGICNQTSGNFELTEKETTGYILQENGVIRFKDSIAKDKNGYPLIRTIVSSNKEYPIQFLTDDISALDINSSNLNQHSIQKPSSYKIKIGKFISAPVKLKLGGVYCILVKPNNGSDSNMTLKVLEITPPNTISMLWLLPQYAVITMGEIMFTVTGLEFSYSQAPNSMKSFIQACWLLTIAFGNLIVVIIESAEFLEKQSYNLFLYSGLMIIDMFIFSIMAMKYKYVKLEEEETKEEVESNVVK